MDVLVKTSQAGVFPAPTLSQLEEALEERQLPDRRKHKKPIKFTERRKVIRRQADRT